MIVSVMQDSLQRALNMVILSSDRERSTMPIVSNVLLQTEGSRLLLATTNLETTLIVHLGAKIDHTGATTVPIQQVREYVRRLSPGVRVDMKLDQSVETLSFVSPISTQSNKTDKMSLKGRPATDFPAINMDAKDIRLEVGAGVLRAMLLEVGVIFPHDESRPVLHSVETTYDGELLKIAGADGYQLAVAQYPITSGDSFEMLVPESAVKILKTILNTMDAEHLVRVGFMGNLLVFEGDDWMLLAQSVEGKFPDWSRLVPQSAATTVNLYSRDLAAACRRARTFVNDAGEVLLTLKPPADLHMPGELRVFAQSIIGDAETLVDCEIDGDPLEIKVNVDYLMAYIETLENEEIESVQIALNGPLAAVTIQPVTATGRRWFGLIMPMANPVQRAPRYINVVPTSDEMETA